MEKNNKDRKLFSVVKFLELPFGGCDEYVCVPYKWVIYRRESTQKAVVAYPNNENPTEIRERAKRMERYDDEWRFYSIEIKYETNIFEDAEHWITTRNNYGPSVPGNPSMNGTQPTTTSDKKLRSGNRYHSSKSKASKPEKPVNKRPISEQSKQQFDTKRTKLVSVTAAKAKCGPIPNPNAKPGCSKSQPLVTSRNDELMESAQTRETTAAIQSEINEDKPPEVFIEEQDLSQCDKQPIETNSYSQNHSNSYTTDALMTAPNRPAIVEQTPQLNQGNNQKHPQDSGNVSSNFQSQIVDVRSMVTTSNDQEPRTEDVSYNGPSTYQHIPDSLSMSDKIHNLMKGKPSLVPAHPPIEMRMRLEKNRSDSDSDSTLITGSLTEPSARETPVTRIQNQSLRDMLVDSQETQHVARINIERPHNAVDPRVVLQSINNVASTSQNPSTTPQPTFMRRFNGQQNLPVPQQHMHQATRGQDPPQRPSGSPNVDQRTNATQHQPDRSDSPIRVGIRPFNRYPGGRRNRFLGGLELPYRAQLMLIQQEARHPPRVPRPPGVFPLPIVENPGPSRRGILRRSPSPGLSEVPKSIIDALLTTRNTYLSNEQRRRILMNESSKQLAISGLENVIRDIRAGQPHDMLSSEMPTGSSYQPPRIGPPLVYENMAQNPRMQNQLVTQPNARNLAKSQAYSQDDIMRSTAAEYSSRGVDSACHTDVYMEEEHVSPSSLVTNLDSGFDTDQETDFGHEMLTDEALIEATNETDQSEHDSVNRPMTAQNCSSRCVLEQQMLDQFATIFTQMGSTLYYTANMFNNLRDSIIETAKTYQTLLGNIEKFNAIGSPASHSSSSRNVMQEVPPVVEERPAAVERGNRGDQPSNNAVNEAPERNHNDGWRFVLPPEYDPEDTKWTLKYRQHMCGLVELLPRSGIYVSHGELRYSKEVSNNCQSLAQRLLLEVFNRNALSVCSSITEIAQVGYKMRPDARPGLYDHGCLVLLTFVLEHGLKRGWNTDMLSILQGLHDKVKQLRYEFGVIAKR